MLSVHIVGNGAGAFVKVPMGNSRSFASVDHAIGTVEVGGGDFLVRVQLQQRHPAVVEEVARALTKALEESNVYRKQKRQATRAGWGGGHLPCWLA